MVTIVTAEHGRCNFTPKMRITGLVFAGSGASGSLNNKKSFLKKYFTVIKRQSHRQLAYSGRNMCKVLFWYVCEKLV